MCCVVEHVGPKVTKEWKKGDRVAAFVHGGAFAEYCTVKGDIALRVPDSLSSEEAVTMVAGAITCGEALYRVLGLPLPGQGTYDGCMLVYGGSSATGTLAIQYAALSGARVIAMASKRNWALLRSLEAEEIFDYRDPDCARNMREHTNNELRLVLDCISEGTSPKICEEAMCSRGGKICYLLPAKHSRPDVEGGLASARSTMGEAYDKSGMHFTAVPENFEHAREMMKITQGLVNEGKLVPHPRKVGERGLEGVFDGLQQMRDGKVSAVKLVYQISQE